jgi:hypothetical protein
MKLLCLLWQLSVMIGHSTTEQQADKLFQRLHQD